MQTLEQTARDMRKRLEETVRKFDQVKFQAQLIVATVTEQASVPDCAQTCAWRIYLS